MYLSISKSQLHKYLIPDYFHKLLYLLRLLRTYLNITSMASYCVDQIVDFMKFVWNQISGKAQMCLI